MRPRPRCGHLRPSWTVTTCVIGGCSLRAIAEEFGTPAYVLDEQALRDRARLFRETFAALHADSHVYFATKAYPSASVIRLLVEEGLGNDVVGEGELRIALAAGADPSTILMHGNAKSDADIAAALDQQIGHIVVDGFDDIDRIARLADRPTPVLLRVSPGVESSTHAALATGGVDSKFGIPVEQVPEAIARMAREPMIELQGLHAHIGSQLFDLDQFEAEVAALASAPPVRRLRLRRRTRNPLCGRRSAGFRRSLGRASGRRGAPSPGHRHPHPGRARPLDGRPQPGDAVPDPDHQARPSRARRRGRRDGRQPRTVALRPAFRTVRRRSLGRAGDDGGPGRSALRIR